MVRIFLICLLLFSILKLKGNNLEIIIYPSNGGDKAYKLTLRGNLISVSLGEVTLSNDSVIFLPEGKEEARSLSDKEVSRINVLTLRLNECDLPEKRNFGFDTWVYSLAIGNIKRARFDSLFLSNKATKRELKLLIKNLVKHSPIEIKLRSFS